MSVQSTEDLSSRILAYQYDWFQNTFPPVIQQTFDDFFATNFSFTLIGVCKNVNRLSDKDSYFVTKIKIDNQHDMFFRISETSIGMVLENVLGRSNRAFDLDKLTELETKIITTFNDCLYRSVVGLLSPAHPTLTRTNFDVVYLVFVLTDQNTGKAGRFVVSLPDVLLNPVSIEEKSEYPIEQFVESKITVALTVGRTVFTLHDLKNLEIDDMVVFEDSRTDFLHLKFLDYEKDVILQPNLSLVVPVDGDEGVDMSGKNDVNIWDSIEVEMVAHFDAVDITLGELKKIQAGMVVDLTSIYQNRVTLTVEDKPIASGELVIVNDKYGVKITEVHAPRVESKVVGQAHNAQASDEEGMEEYSEDEVIDENGEVVDGMEGEEDEEFDYSDFDLEEDI